MARMHVFYRITQDIRQIGESERTFEIGDAESGYAGKMWRDYRHTQEHGGNEYWNRKACIYFYPIYKEIRERESERLGLPKTKFGIEITGMKVIRETADSKADAGNG